MVIPFDSNKITFVVFVAISGVTIDLYNEI
jgi:hypothetical protein